jgi:uncharacterized protein (TIGR02145 family)
MNKYILLLSFLIATIQLKAQSKKEQIQILSLRIDSLTIVISNERNTHDNQLKEYSQSVFNLKSEIKSLKEGVKLLEADKKSLKERINLLDIDKQSIEFKLSKRIKDLEDSLDNSKNITNESTSIITGKQVWMSKNLNVSVFRNGDPIPEAKTNEEWEEAGRNGMPAWCYYENNPANGNKYGKLYNWFAVSDPRGLAPAGWHVPSELEWTIYINYFGSKINAGKKMKSTYGWKSAGYRIKKTGFSGLLAGSGSNGDAEDIGSWWSFTNITIKGTKIYCLSRFGVEVFTLSLDDYSYGLSIRCIKD